MNVADEVPTCTEKGGEKLGEVLADSSGGKEKVTSRLKHNGRLTLVFNTRLIISSSQPHSMTDAWLHRDVVTRAFQNVFVNN